jgi:hypothetical protein
MMNEYHRRHPRGYRRTEGQSVLYVDHHVEWAKVPGAHCPGGPWVDVEFAALADDTYAIADFDWC